MKENALGKIYVSKPRRVGYATGELASSFTYTVITSFMLVYLASYVGLDNSTVGLLIMISKLFDGGSDLVFGVLMDKTKTKWGKAKPWILFGQAGLSILLIMLFSIPENLPETIKYVYFFITYTLINAVFLTANKIAYAALSALISINKTERLDLGVIRFMFTFIGGLIISTTTLSLVDFFGADANAWSIVAIIFAVLSAICSLICVFSVKELPPEELEKAVDTSEKVQDKVRFVDSVKYLVKNKYFLIMLGVYLVYFTVSSVTGGSTVFFARYVLGSDDFYATLAIAASLPTIVSILLVPLATKKLGSMQKTVTVSVVLSIVMSVVVVVGVLTQNFILILIGAAGKAFLLGPIAATLDPFVAEASKLEYMKNGVRLEGSMFSCTSFGIKVGSSIGSALLGFMLDASSFDGMLDVQPDSAIMMLSFIFAFLPLIVGVINYLLYKNMDVEAAIKAIEDNREKNNILINEGE